MHKRKFTLEDIKKCLEDLGFVWKDKIIYDSNIRRYKKAKKEYFKNNVFLLLTNKITNQTSQIIATINENIFELCHHKSRIDYTKHWIEYLEEKENVKNI